MPISHRIGIVGTFRSGKTVFLTSLINHLQEHSPARFEFSKGTTIKNFRFDNSAKVGPKFNYAEYRDCLVHRGKWPQKTKDSSHLICKFKRSDYRFRTSRLHFFDFPGERVADAHIAANESYGEWSDEILNYYRSHKSYRDTAQEFMDACKTEVEDESKLLYYYKLALARMAHAHRPQITPSTFLLDLDGVHVPPKPPEELATTRIAGQLPDQKSNRGEFVPLPDDYRTKHPVLAEKFASHYQTYRQEVVLPVFSHLRSCHRLIVLIDIPMLLASGVDTFNDNREILKQVFESLNPELSLGQQIQSVLKRWWLAGPFSQFLKDNRSCLDRVAFVANKSDLALPDDVSSGKLLKLLKQMTERIAFDLNGVAYEWFTCSAAVAGKPADKKGYLRGVPVYGNPAREQMVFEVSELPDSWPDRWDAHEFNFQWLMPDVPAAQVHPPQHHNLDKVFEFISKE